MTEPRLDIALLTPVPLEHLEDGAELCRAQGKVAYGSRDWETFRKLDELRQGRPVDVFIHASPDHSDGPPRVRWHARYIGHVDSVNGAHPAGMTYRPPSTARYTGDNQGHWAVFRETDTLAPLPAEE